MRNLKVFLVLVGLGLMMNYCSINPPVSTESSYSSSSSYSTERETKVEEEKPVPSISGEEVVLSEENPGVVIKKRTYVIIEEPSTGVNAVLFSSKTGFNIEKISGNMLLLGKGKVERLTVGIGSGKVLIEPLGEDSILGMYGVDKDPVKISCKFHVFKEEIDKISKVIVFAFDFKLKAFSSSGNLLDEGEDILEFLTPADTIKLVLEPTDSCKETYLTTFKFDIAKVLKKALSHD